MDPAPRPKLEEIQAAADRLKGAIVRTPLVRLSPLATEREVYLKLENLQPIGSFKVRGAGNAVGIAGREALADGVYTASAGNMAQGVAWSAARWGTPCTVVVPDHAPRTKLAAIERLGARTLQVPFDDWWQVLVEHRYQDLSGHFIHPVSDSAVIAGNGTIGLEILEDLPEVATVVVPFGGGGLSCGIASAVKSQRSGVRLVAAEVSTAAPLSAAFSAGRPVPVHYEPSFVDGIGGKGVLEEMWPLAEQLVDQVTTVTPTQVACAVRLLVEGNRVVAEGAGAVAIAVELAQELPEPVVCVVSGGNLDTAQLRTILAGEVPVMATDWC